MNLWLRLLWTLVTAWRQPRLTRPTEGTSRKCWVWPHDMDTSLHMNNGRYWTLMDLGRVDLVLRLGLLRPMLRNKWIPLVSAGTIRFRRELRLFASFDIQTRLVFWRDTHAVIEQRFVSRASGTVTSTALVLAGIYDRKQKSFVPIETLLALSGFDAESPPATADVEAFLRSEAALRATTARDAPAGRPHLPIGSEQGEGVREHMDTRIASIGDAAAMSQVLREIVEQTGRDRPYDEAFVTKQYLANPASIRCTVAIDGAGEVVGFQSLVRAETGNRYEVPEGWGIIGTHISPRVHRQGVGSALFRSSREAAEQARLQKIDAYISADNPSGLRYYEAMGFQTYRQPEGIVQKVYTVG